MSLITQIYVPTEEEKIEDWNPLPQKRKKRGRMEEWKKCKIRGSESPHRRNVRIGDRNLLPQKREKRGRMEGWKNVRIGDRNPESRNQRYE